jgi:L-2-hydroxyglutarate oxidase LhgO
MWRLLDRFPEDISAKRIGKWIGATSPLETEKLAGIVLNMKSLGIPHRMLSQREMKLEEPRVAFTEAVLSSSTGIVDVSSLRDFFLAKISAAGTDSLAITRSKVSRVRACEPQGFEVSTVQGDSFTASRVILSCGLHTETLWKSGNICFSDGTTVPFDERCKTFFCKGRYVGYRDNSVVKRLVYPCPLANLKGLGVHSVVDMNGAVRFGPDAHYTTDQDDLSVTNDVEFLDAAFREVQKYIPSIEREKMFVDFAGMRAKLSDEGESFRDFHIDLVHSKLPGCVVLAGIESPGLTSCTSIADHVVEMMIPRETVRLGPSSTWS